MAKLYLSRGAADHSLRGLINPPVFFSLIEQVNFLGSSPPTFPDDRPDLNDFRNWERILLEILPEEGNADRPAGWYSALFRQNEWKKLKDAASPSYS